MASMQRWWVRLRYWRRWADVPHFSQGGMAGGLGRGEKRGTDGSVHPAPRGVNKGGRGRGKGGRLGTEPSAPRFSRIAEFPEYLAQHAEDHGDVAGWDFQAADEAAHFFVGGSSGNGVYVAASVQRLEQPRRDLFGFGRGGGADLARPGRSGLGIARHLVEAKGDRLTEVHGEVLADGGDADEPVTVAQVLVGEAELFAAEDQRYGCGGQFAQHEPGAILQAANGVLQLAMSHAGSADHQAAIGDRVGQSGKFLRLLKQRRGADGGAGLTEGHIVGANHGEAREAEVGHGAGGGTDVERVARRHQDYAQVVLPVGSDASIVTHMETLEICYSAE